MKRQPEPIHHQPEAPKRFLRYMMARNQAAAALPHYRQWLRLRPESAQAQFGLGSALAMAGEGAAAIPYLRKAAAGEDAAVRDAAMRLLRQLGAAQ